ncbi:MAG: Beta-galactosidase [Promethearchaeota archaeon]|nr:MAG: Beta-galactosidase [Candidatus Lokiarchaeota archaeon]
MDLIGDIIMIDNNNYQWHPIEGQIMTRWSRDITPNNPLPEYPRPQLRRDDWINLNGLWDYAIRPKEQKKVDYYDGKILVPFPVESALSGVKKELNPQENLWYRCQFRLPKEWNKNLILLHFGAVDWEATIFVNKKKIGIHRGGYTPFTFDISSCINFDSDNDLIVKVWDPTDEGSQERGKQTLHPSHIWYTAVSGIWQTVWLEPVPTTYITSIKLTPNIDNEILNVSVLANTPLNTFRIRVEITIEDKIVSSLESAETNVEINIPSPLLWEPEHPFLYDLKVLLEKNEEIIDTIYSYFGMRKIALGKDVNGIRSIELNNKRIFQYGTLDQGYWPDGLYTAPTDEALRNDIEITKELGFNMIRKHVKVEPARWYYHCDKLGILIWQDMPNGGGQYSWALPPNINEYEESRGEKSKKCYYEELKSMINCFFNFPSIITWVPFNEGWGQFDTEEVANYVQQLDPGRLVDAASGWYDFRCGHLCDIHTYPNPLLPNQEMIDSRAAVVGEFGGLGLEIEDHIWDIKDRFVYRKMRDRNKLIARYHKLIEKLKDLMEQGLSAAIYTQITDVEGEVNGLLTYDREILKMENQNIQMLHKSIFSGIDST